ncbi:Protein SENSITIVITY TO RED LIGHT REDUCED 1 [Auxenochlorella protothecoides]|uniref:Protein SENSITIVITY TO RED LIGHT REDUCED 1 n=1 Tax=Auxenochlorella protothecoides TaxID=3075 RepID=A0A087SDQ5_AUXPR|nr:Protein SENSITIVITY TO RED LIGHT REDUCED 1 [Auxenochlorella protothecoides]KFM23859.1 Protein SENSITIVITY TO RED LIGHT REDUCED 1 [Auxenochlorella protothecoides]
MQDPVVLGDTGNTYERSTISMWLERCARAGRAATDPLTGLVVGDAPKSLIQGWASRHYIVDLGRFSKARRTKRATPSKQPATEAAIGTSGSPSTTPASPRTAEHQGPDSPTHRLEGGASRSEGHHAEPPALPPPRPARPLYPDPGDPASARLGLDGVPEALAALHPSRLAAGGYPAQAKAAYAARTLSTLASQREAQDAMMEHQAVPLALVLLGRRLAPADATPHLLRILQRLAAWRGDVAQEIVACGGILTAASLLSEPAPEVRAAAASLLYFLVQQQPGRGRQAALDALAGQAARGRMPPRPLMAFWRWHRPVPGAEAGAGPEGETEAGASAGALAAADASLACLVHALVSGDVGFCRADALDARDTAQLAGLCRGLWLLCAARGTDPAAVRAACHASPHFPEFVRGVLRCAALDPGSPLLPRLLGWLGALCHEPRSPSASLAAATEGVRAALATVLPDLLPALLREVEAGTASPPGKRCWWWLGGSLRRAELACTLTCNLAASRGGAGLGPSSAEAPAGPSGSGGLHKDERPASIEERAHLRGLLDKATDMVAQSRFFSQLVASFQELAFPSDAQEHPAGEGASPPQTLAQVPVRATVWGLGSLRQPRAAHIRCQLALLCLLRAGVLQRLSGPITAVDPAFTPADVDLLESLGMEARLVHAGNTPVARKPTLFFLAHCSADLTDSLLSSNRAAGTLHNLVLLGNSLSAIAAAWQHGGPAAGHAAISTILDLVQPGSCMREVALPEYAFPVISAFNDISIHTFWAAPPLKQTD